ncbi:MAG: DUF6259 domain-containing protein [Planctomycetota bacterium]
MVSHVDLTRAAEWCDKKRVEPRGLGAVSADGRQLPFQFVPDFNYDATEHIAGTVVMKLPPDAPHRIRLVFDGTAASPSEQFDGTVRTEHYELVQAADQLGGMPSTITFRETEKEFETLSWHDRVHHAEQGSYRLINDRKATVETVSAGPLCTVVRVSGRYMRGTEQPVSKPTAVYQWYYFHDSPLVYVTALQEQEKAFAWDEWHFLELIYPDDAFPRWAGAAPKSTGKVTGDGKTRRFSDWAALVDGRNAIAMLRSGRLVIHDGRGGYGTYLHAFGDLAWKGFEGTQRRLAAWLWIGAAEEPLAAIRKAAATVPTDGLVKVTVDTVRDRLAELEKEVDELDAEAARRAWWRLATARQLESQGRFKEAMAAVDGQLPDEWVSLSAGDLGLMLERAGTGFQLLQLADLDRRQSLLATSPLPLFQVTIRHAKTAEEIRLAADAGWKRVEADTAREGSVTLRWRQPSDKRLGGLSVTVTGNLDPESDRIAWGFRIENVPEPWGVWRGVFPQVSLSEPGEEAEIFYPRGAGEVKAGAWDEDVRFAGTYPSGWLSMPFMAVYDRGNRTGLYTGIHDPLASTKDLTAESRPGDRAVDLSYTHPVPNMGQPGTGFELEGTAVWQLLRGDWFDAAVLYRDWVRQHARWYPQLGPNGREDTPEWMRELSCWALASGTPEQVVPATKAFQQAIGLPVGVHWYNWHQIPFDNDYPHYFPTKEGFAEGVAELQSDEVFVMPYINGRLWDTHDRGKDVFQFDEVALPAATKNEAGEPYTETYGSKESDGSPVELAAMCPTTHVWKSKVREIVLRLMNECGVSGVYIDQVAAAKPRLCFDASHGHPLGGGHWWTQSYWDLLSRIDEEMPAGRILTTECNAEPYVHRFDGYLTWHWQYDGQVPAFPAVYGGAIQMFGRAYRGGPTKERALRMKAGQQLVYGEQIGWINPSVRNEPDSIAFLRQVVHLRAKLIDYFVAGQMARPPRLKGDMPTVTADWRWSGEWPVTTDAVLTGAWRLADRDRVVLIFVNVSEKPCMASFDFKAANYGLAGETLQYREVTAEGREVAWRAGCPFSEDLNVPATSARAWEIEKP